MTKLFENETEDDEETEPEKINFSVNLDVKTENEPFESMAKELGIDRTTYIRKILAYEIKHKTVFKKLKI